MRLTYMESGNARMEDMIASVRNGLYVDEFSNGQVKIGEGDFTFYVKSGDLIENGRLTMPFKDINVIGNGPEVLENIMAVGDDLKVDDSCWTCGKDQSVAVGCGMPSVLIRELIVIGNKVLNSCICKLLVSVIHFLNSNRKSSGCLARICYNRD
mgnify:CR=1 FL=1